MNALNLIIDTQAKLAKDIPIPLVGRARRNNLRPAAIVDLTLRHYAGHGLKDKAKEERKKANREYKLADKKLRRDIYKYNFNGIAEHGLAFNHMGTYQKREWFKRLVTSDTRIPDAAMKWGKDRGLI